MFLEIIAMKSFSTFVVIVTAVILFANEGISKPVQQHENVGLRNFVSSVSSRRIHQDHGRQTPPEYPFVVDLTEVDPCRNITCMAGEVCIVHNTDSTRCIPNEEITDFVDHCSPCHPHHHHDNPICGDNGQTFTSTCELEYFACINDNNIRRECDGECPCLEKQDIAEPRNIRITSLPNDLTTARIMITWSPPDGFTEVGDVKEYIIHYMRVTVSGGDWSQVHAPGVLSSINIAGLVPGTEYYFRVQAVIGSTKGRESDVMLFRTSPIRSEEYSMEAVLTDIEDGDITDDEDASGDGAIEYR